MFNKLIHFIKYNNATVIIIVVIFIVGTSALASETGRAAIGKKQISIQGVDNTLLLEADLEKMDMEFKIEKIEEDEKMYYITYTYLDLIKVNNAWQYQLKEKVRRVSKKLKQDLGVYLAEELKEEYQARIKKLSKEQKKALVKGEEKRIEVIEYSGLIGGVLDLTAKVFPDYEPVKKVELESPVPIESLRELKISSGEGESSSSGVDNLTKVYEDYIAKNDPDRDNVFGVSDNCPMIYNPDQLDNDGDGLGDVCDIDNIETSEKTDQNDNQEGAGEEEQTVEVIELPGAEETGESVGETNAGDDKGDEQAEAQTGASQPEEETQTETDQEPEPEVTDEEPQAGAPAEPIAEEPQPQPEE